MQVLGGYQIIRQHIQPSGCSGTSDHLTQAFIQAGEIFLKEVTEINDMVQVVMAAMRQ